MALPGSGQITLNQVNVELGLSGTAQIGMNDSAVRTLFGIASGEIEMSDGYGKANEFTLTISSSTQEANLATLASSAGWNGSSALICNINSNIYVWSDDTSTAGLLLTGSFPGGVIVNNSGFIMGRGGQSGGNPGGYAGRPGGDAIEISSSSSVTINNNSGAYIGGGGGGGGGMAGGGGAGGGGGGENGQYNYAYDGRGGTIGNLGQNGNDPYNAGSQGAGGGGAGGGGGGGDTNYQLRRGGGGGRIFPGISGYGGYGTSKSGGTGGREGYNGASITGFAGAGAGGWGANGGTTYGGGIGATSAGGTGGKAIEDNGSSYTLSNNGTIYGAT